MIAHNSSPLSDFPKPHDSGGKKNEDSGKTREHQRLSSSMTAEILVGNEQRIAATVRNISSSGMGFLLRGPVQLGEVIVNVRLDDEDVKLRLLMEWCQPNGNGMYLGGGSYLRRPNRHDESAV